MQLLVPAASAVCLAAVTLSVAVITLAFSDHSAQPTSAPARSAQVTSEGPALPTVGGTTTLPGADTAAKKTTRVLPRQEFAWPMSPRPAVRRRFEQPRKQWSRGHRGVDLLAVAGQPVLSAGDGVVAFSGVIAGRGVITVRHSGGLRTTYEPVDKPLASGSLVHRGARIGVVSPAPGHCVPLTCLHWGAIAGATYRDPLSLLGFGRPILLPLG